MNISEKSNMMDFVTECFNDEFMKSFSYMSKTNSEEYEKLFLSFREWFDDVNLIAFFHPNYIKDKSQLFNNRTYDGMSIKDRAFVSFMENFTNATLAKMHMYYGRDDTKVQFNETCLSVSEVLGMQFNKTVPFYDERFISGLPTDSSDVFGLLQSVPMLCFYYIVAVNITKTRLYETNLLYADKIGASKRKSVR